MRSINGVTIGNNWMYNNPDLVYPTGWQNMSPAQLENNLTHKNLVGVVMVGGVEVLRCECGWCAARIEPKKGNLRARRKHGCIW